MRRPTQALAALPPGSAPNRPWFPSQQLTTTAHPDTTKPTKPVVPVCRVFASMATVARNSPNDVCLSDLLRRQQHCQTIRHIVSGANTIYN